MNENIIENGMGFINDEKVIGKWEHFSKRFFKTASKIDYTNAFWNFKLSGKQAILHCKKLR